MDEGLRVLAAEGAPAVRIDRIAARLGLSKGSFHHHFAGADGYKRDLLALYEALSVDALASATGGAGPAFAYCRSGNSSAVLWALTQAGERPAGEILRIAADAGYDLSGIAPMLDRKV